ncbi:MAG: sigma-54 dependent transcriptional regulator [Deltaproteobacteria bacterium]|nr:sigma-54 dependent transcriptional regulator [Deltaproteobacteria bacterium]
MKKRVLVVDDEKLIRWTLVETMSRAGHEVLEATNGVEALRIAEAELPDAILLDLKMPEMDGLTVLSELEQRQIDAAVIVISAQSDLETAVEAMRRGAEDFIKKPFDADEVEVVVARSLDRRVATRELARQQAQAEAAFQVNRLSGDSPATEELRQLLQRVADSDARGVLVTGESGSGKGLVAHILHFGSRRHSEPFVRLTSVGREDDVLEREIFGFEKAAVPSAAAAGRGLIERASGGTLYIEEVADLPLICQARLVDVIEDRVVRRVGGVRSLAVDVRVVAATNKDLAARVEEGKFREDLYYRLSSVPLHLPPLRDRLDDLPALTRSLLEELAPELGARCEPLTEAVLARLRQHDWPGNTRELRNVLERAMILAGGRCIEPSDVAVSRPRASTAPDPTTLAFEGMTLDEVERELIRRAMERAGGNQAKAARALGLSRDTLRYRLKKHGM